MRTCLSVTGSLRLTLAARPYAVEEGGDELGPSAFGADAR